MEQEDFGLYTIDVYKMVAHHLVRISLLVSRMVDGDVILEESDVGLV